MPRTIEHAALAPLKGAFGDTKFLVGEFREMIGDEGDGVAEVIDVLPRDGRAGFDQHFVAQAALMGEVAHPVPQPRVEIGARLQLDPGTAQALYEHGGKAAAGPHTLDDPAPATAVRVEGAAADIGERQTELIA